MVIVPNSALDNRIVLLWHALVIPDDAPAYTPEQVSGNAIMPYVSSGLYWDDTAHGNVHVGPPNTLGYWYKGSSISYAIGTIPDLALGAEDFFIDMVAKCSSATGDFTVFEVYKDANNFFGLYRLYSTRTLRFYAKSGGVCIADYHTDNYYSWLYWWHIGVWRTGGTMGITLGGAPQTVHEITAISSTALPADMTHLAFGYSQGGFSWQNTGFLQVKYIRVCKGAVPIATTGFPIAATTYVEDIRSKRIVGVYI